MSNARAKEIRDYFSTWLDRQKRVADQVPEVQRAFEAADWQYRAWTDVSSAAPETARFEIEQKFERTLENIKTNLPLPPDYPSSPSSGILVTITGSTSNIYGAVLNAHELKDFGKIADPHIAAYEILQNNHDRRSEAQDLLLNQFPGLLSQFTSALNSLERAKSGHDEVAMAANQMRILLDNLKGELFNRARRHEKDNMTWETMAERLGTIPDPKSAEDLINEQGGNRSQMYSRLSDLTKKRGKSNTSEINTLWPLILDHIFVILRSMK